MRSSLHVLPASLGVGKNSPSLAELFKSWMGADETDLVRFMRQQRIPLDGYRPHDLKRVQLYGEQVRTHLQYEGFGMDAYAIREQAVMLLRGEKVA